MENGFDAKEASDLAGSRHEQESSASRGPHEEEHGFDGHRHGIEDDQGGICPQGEAEASDAIDAVLADASPEKRAEIIAEIREMRWKGCLPPPESFNKYPDWVQREIVELAKQGADNTSAIIESSIRLDSDQSNRLDKLVEIERKQMTIAQVGTIAVNLALVVGASFAAACGQQAAAAAMVGGLAVVNVATLTVGRSRKTRKGDSELVPDKPEQELSEE